MKKSQVHAKHMRADISPRKAGVVIDLIRGRPLEEAKVTLNFDNTKAAKILLKLLKSAEANAVNNNKLDPKNLYISEAYIGPAPVSKRANYGARGRFSLKTTRKSHLYLGLSEENL
jgi:large subunit ribosomal protein L22